MPKLVISHLTIRHQRCFFEKTFFFEKPIVIIQGRNGSGKTSLLEALFFPAQMNSFRTTSIKEMIFFNEKSFLIKISLFDQGVLQVAFLEGKKRVRFNETLITKSNQLADIYQAVSLTQEDLEIVQDSPEYRRSFFDYIICQLDSQMTTIFHRYKVALSKKQEWLMAKKGFDQTWYAILSEEIDALSFVIQEQRKKLIQKILVVLAPLQQQLFMKNAIFSFDYKSKMYSGSDLLSMQEYKQGRVLVGAHLDDIIITLNGINIRLFGSRGQQKAMIFLLKIAQILLLLDANKHSGKVFLIDDFLTDFDQETAKIFLEFIQKLPIQIFITIPVEIGAIFEDFKDIIQKIYL